VARAQQALRKSAERRLPNRLRGGILAASPGEVNMRNIGPARLALLAAAMAVAALLGSPAPALGASFTVDATHDAVDASLGDGVCADAGGACTLRAAVMETNALPGADEISLPAGTYTLSISGVGEDASATGDLDITDALTISAAGRETAVIDGARVDRVFHIVGPVSAAIEAVSIQNGLAGRAAAPSLESCDRHGDGGGICNEGQLTLSRSSVVSNEAGSGGGVFSGVGSRVTVDLSVIDLNTAAGGPVGSFGEGGGIDVYGVLSASQIEVAGNAAAVTGGGLATRGTSSVVASTVSGNTSGNVGGGIMIIFGSTLTLTNTTVSNNSAGAPGSGLENQGELVMRSSTVAGNNALGGAGFHTFGGRQTFVNTIIAGNASTDCGLATQYPPVSQGHNLDSDGSCAFSAPGDISNVDPRLGPLADNGGPTLTHALLPPSPGFCSGDACTVPIPPPAIDGGANDGCPASDQRGFPRPVDGNGDSTAACDIGAFELEAVAQTPEPTVAPTSTPVQPVDLPRTGGGSDGQGPPPIADVAAAPLLAGGAASLWRIARRWR
jgi:hypothetical protein